MTLRYSRRCFRRVVWKSSQQTWAELHEQAFRYFGGATRYVVLDNLKEGVIKPDLYEPELNPVYAAMLAHYGSVADPARVRDPNRKGAVESAIQHTQATALKGRRFDSLQAQNDFLEDWELRWAAPRIHGREKRQVQAMFEEERAALTTLPALRFSSFRDLVRTVCDDTTVRVDNSNYAARPAAIGQKVLVRLYEHLVEIRDRSTQALLRTHARSNRPGSVILPDEERPFNPSRHSNCLPEPRALGQAACRCAATGSPVRGGWASGGCGAWWGWPRSTHPSWWSAPARTAAIRACARSRPWAWQSGHWPRRPRWRGLTVSLQGLP